MKANIPKPATSSPVSFWHYFTLGLGAFAFLSSIHSYRTFGKGQDANEKPAEPQDETLDLEQL